MPASVGDFELSYRTPACRARHQGGAGRQCRSVRNEAVSAGAHLWQKDDQEAPQTIEKSGRFRKKFAMKSYFCAQIYMLTGKFEEAIKSSRVQGSKNFEGFRPITWALR
jgi:hypothetical protein